ncbi:hypothetical protein Vadar_023485 [Vaccinium darrowii]|uniref:Uncharacterized protein n=1 Tax=Vaccinium darrowii TaxID=229202 RepID=A0ACB7XJV6_9ERIC|nr:hypothetical protein Vadar_023485 [Vaccinium darrowii]
MKEEEITPNSFTFAAVLTACRHSGLVEEGRKHFESMRKDYSIGPGLEHCACMVDLLGRAGQLAEAYEFIDNMPSEPDSDVWGALLGACRIHAGRWEDVARLRKLMEERELKKKIPGHSFVERGRDHQSDNCFLQAAASQEVKVIACFDFLRFINTMHHIVVVAIITVLASVTVAVANLFTELSKKGDKSSSTTPQVSVFHVSSLNGAEMNEQEHMVEDMADVLLETS